MESKTWESRGEVRIPKLGMMRRKQLTQLLADGLLKIFHMFFGVAQLIAVDDDRTHRIQISFAGLAEIGYGQSGQLRLIFVGSFGGSFDKLVVVVDGGQKSQGTRLF